MEELTLQDLHNLAMIHVGKELENNGFEFLAVNSQLKKHPQFVCVDKPTNTIHFVMVQAATYPSNSADYDPEFMETFIHHAKTKNAKVLFAGVGFANAQDYEKPIYKNQDYIMNYEGITEIL